MITVLTILTGLSMLATLGVLLAGMLDMTRTPGDSHRSNRLMQLRVTLQGVTLLLFALLLWFLRG